MASYFWAQRPHHLAQNPQAGKAVCDSLDFGLTQKVDHRLGIEFLTGFEIGFALGENRQGAPRLLVGNVHRGSLECLGNLESVLIVGDVETALTPDQPFFQEGNGDGHLLRRVLVDRADVVPLFQPRQLPL